MELGLRTGLLPLRTDHEVRGVVIFLGSLQRGALGLHVEGRNVGVRPVELILLLELVQVLVVDDPRASEFEEDAQHLDEL